MARRVRGKEPELKGSVGDPDVGAIAHYEDPDYYDVAYRSRHDDVAYYVRLGRLSGGPVLEYGVGTGRIALPLARAGVDVTGVDLSAPMLAQLARKLDSEPPDVKRRVRTVRGDMRTVRLRKRFPLVIAAFNTVLHLLERRDVEHFLAGVKSHLAPGGQLVFDFSVPHPDYLGADPGRRFGHPRFRHPTRGLVKYGERFDYDPLRQVLTMKLEFTPADGTAPWVVPLTHRQFFPLEMESLLHYAGFGEIEWASDFTDSPPDHETDSLVVSCRMLTERKPGRGRRRHHGSRGGPGVD